MKIPKKTAQIIILGCGLTALYMLIQDVGAVAWFAGICSSGIALGSISWENNPKMDRDFFGILVTVSCGVALAIAWGQWKILDRTGWDAVIIPTGVFIVWQLRERPIFPDKQGKT